MLVANTLTSVSLAAIFCQFYTEARLRDKVIQLGTTLGPDFHRPEGKRSVPCPESHSYGFNNGHDCCRTYDKINDTKLHPDCDGGRMTAGTNFLCCKNQDSISCPWGQICSDRRRASSWSSWTPWACNHTTNTLRREKFCTKAHIQKEECPPEMIAAEEQPCEGHWGSWSTLSDCSSTYCGSGIQTKNRTCDNPTPMELSEDCLMTNGTRGLAEVSVSPCEAVACPDYQGCYIIINLDIVHAMVVITPNSNVACVNHCQIQGYPASGTFDKYCYCGSLRESDAGKRRGDHECNYNCAGYPSESCGGNMGTSYNLLSVYFPAN